MNKKLLKLAPRREHLVAEFASQRLVLAQIADTLHRPLGVADQGLTVLRYVQNHPIWLAGSSLALLAILRPRHIIAVPGIYYAHRKPRHTGASRYPVGHEVHLMF